VADIKNSKNNNEPNEENLKDIEFMRPKTIDYLRYRQNNKDHADISHARQQQKVCIVDEVLLAQ
jgi:hypothetical protein